MRFAHTAPLGADADAASRPHVPTLDDVEPVYAPLSITRQDRSLGRYEGIKIIDAEVSDVLSYVGWRGFKGKVSLDIWDTYELYDRHGARIDNERLVELVKSTKQFRSVASNLKMERISAIEELADRLEAYDATFTDVHLASVDVLPERSYIHALAELSWEPCEPEPYPEHAPSPLDIKLELSEEADHEVVGCAPWRLGELRERYVRERYEQRFAERTSQYQTLKDGHDARQRIACDQENARRREEFEQRKAFYEGAISPDAAFVERTAQQRLAAIELPFCSQASFEFRPDDATLMLDIRLPGDDILSQNIYTSLYNGTLHTEDKSTSTLGEQYKRFVFGISVCVASHMFAISPCVQRVTLSCCALTRDIEGSLVDDYVLSVRFRREGFIGLDYATLEPERLCMRFENRCRTLTWGSFLGITPYD